VGGTSVLNKGFSGANKPKFRCNLAAQKNTTNIKRKKAHPNPLNKLHSARIPPGECHWQTTPRHTHFYVFFAFFTGHFHSVLGG
jgi:hypothetical protein